MPVYGTRHQEPCIYPYRADYDVTRYRVARVSTEGPAWRDGGRSSTYWVDGDSEIDQTWSTGQTRNRAITRDIDSRKARSDNGIGEWTTSQRRPPTSRHYEPVPDSPQRAEVRIRSASHRHRTDQKDRSKSSNRSLGAVAAVAAIGALAGYGLSKRGSDEVKYRKRVRPHFDAEQSPVLAARGLSGREGMKVADLRRKEDLYGRRSPLYSAYGAAEKYTEHRDNGVTDREPNTNRDVARSGRVGSPDQRNGMSLVLSGQNPGFDALASWSQYAQNNPERLRALVRQSHRNPIVRSYLELEDGERPPTLPEQCKDPYSLNLPMEDLEETTRN